MATDPRQQQLQGLIDSGQMISPHDPFEKRRLMAKGVFRVHAAKPIPRVPDDPESLDASLLPSPDLIFCRHCGRPASRWDEPCGRDMLVVTRSADK